MSCLSAALANKTKNQLKKRKVSTSSSDSELVPQPVPLIEEKDNSFLGKTIERKRMMFLLKKKVVTLFAKNEVETIEETIEAVKKTKNFIQQQTQKPQRRFATLIN